MSFVLPDKKHAFSLALTGFAAQQQWYKIIL